MKQLPFIAASLYCQPWAILPQNHAELGQLYRSYIAGQLGPATGIQSRAAAMDAGTTYLSSGISFQMDPMSGICVLNLEGVIVKRAPEMMCGPALVDLALLDGLLQELALQPGLRTLVLNINSPGGSVTGLQETAENLRELAENVRLVAYADCLCASAGYYLAAACDEIYTAPSAMIGSIGTYVAALDDSRAWELEGLSLKLFRVGTLKAIGHPGKTWTPEEEAHLQQMADDAGAEFRGWCLSRRPGIPDAAMQGQVFFGKSAPTGLIDGLHRDIESLLAALMV
jgi:signal peptide peptidase SppA